jgi:hypothetical protein
MTPKCTSLPPNAGDLVGLQVNLETLFSNVNKMKLSNQKLRITRTEYLHSQR